MRKMGVYLPPRYRDTPFISTATVSTSRFENHVDATFRFALTAVGQSANYYYNTLVDAHKKQHRYRRIAKDLTYGQMTRLRTFPLFRLGGVRGGLVVEAKNSA